MNRDKIDEGIAILDSRIDRLIGELENLQADIASFKGSTQPSSSSLQEMWGRSVTIRLQATQVRDGLRELTHAQVKLEKA